MSDGRIGKKFGNWLVGERLGGGGNGDVFQAGDGTRTGAIKFLRDPFWKKPENRIRYERFKREAEVVSRLSHGGILPQYGANLPDSPTNGNPPWIVTALAKPIDCELIQSSGPFPVQKVIEIGLAIAEVLEYLHTNGVVHRDVHTGNIFELNGQWLLGDFGLTDFDGAENITASDGPVGPTRFLAPEMLNDAATADGKAADVYLLFKTLWYLATKRYPTGGTLWRRSPVTNFSDQALTTSANHRPVSFLNQLFEDATNEDPAKRPIMGYVVKELKRWLQPPEPISVSTADVTKYAELFRDHNIATAPRIDHAARAAEMERQQSWNKRLTSLLASQKKQFDELLSQAGFEIGQSSDYQFHSYYSRIEPGSPHIRSIGKVRTLHSSPVNLFLELYVLSSAAQVIFRSSLAVYANPSFVGRYEGWVSGGKPGMMMAVKSFPPYEQCYPSDSCDEEQEVSRAFNYLTSQLPQALELIAAVLTGNE